MSIEPYEVFFTGRNDPRDGCIIIGEDVRHVFYEFDTETIDYAANMRTTIQSDRQPVATFEWSMSGREFGLATIYDRSIPMTQLVMPTGQQNARMFTSIDGRVYSWRRMQEDPNSYELIAAPGHQIGIFRRFDQETPVGPSWGTFQYIFTDPMLLLESLMALNLNRWLDGTYGLTSG